MTAMVRRYHIVGGSQRTDDVSKKVDRDVQAIVWAMGLHNVRRYFHQRFWEEETRASEFAARIEPFPRLESVAEHSWHLAYICTLLAPRHPDLDQVKTLRIAALHDILEIISGDDSPIGRDGTGRTTHAFNQEVARQRAAAEELALNKYLERLPPDAVEEQRTLLSEYRDALSQEAKFVKSIDKLQTLVFVLLKKQGDMEDKHLRFTISYSEKGISYFPPLEDHFRNLQHRILEQAAACRRTSVAELRSELFGTQLSFWQ
jgi:5'-deoxynucleotidase YfbR-like HD superfamily hydrolase